MVKIVINETKRLFCFLVVMFFLVNTSEITPQRVWAASYDFIVSTEASTTKVEIGQDFTYDIKVKPYNNNDKKYFTRISLELAPEDGFSISNVTSSDSTVNITRNHSTGTYTIQWAPKYDGIVDCESNLATVTMRSIGGDGNYDITSKTLSVSPSIYHYQGGIYTGYTYTTDFDTVSFYKGCGENLTWSLNTSGLLTINGTGTMRNYSDSGVPWGKNIKSVVIKNGVTSIGDYAFSGCLNLESVTIPESVTSVGIASFSGCTSLKGISLPSKLTTIGSSALRECTSLKEIAIPNGVKELEWCNLMDCTSLEKITLPASITKLGLSAIGGCTSLTDIYYEGTESEWNNILKTEGWDSNSVTPSGGYTLHFRESTFISIFDYQVIGTYVLIDLSVNNMTDTATLYFATYDESGRMLEMQTPTLTDGSTRIILPLGTIHKIKAFVWEDNLQPIACYAEKVL